mmetsp:Transcript_62332/g.148819  ORF Transcript_62332/g.148819 Transcript_62332/m.148819 type:complete len:986 (-) Transcript_62332:92-3049(-)
MRRLDPQASLALPPLVEAPIPGSGGVWEVKEAHFNVTKKVKSLSARGPHRSTGSDAADASLTARGVAGEVGLVSPESGVPVSPPSGSKHGATKGRTIENWLNRTLDQARFDSSRGLPTTGGAANQKQGLSHFGIDVAALEKLGLDTATSERVYRAMFVYSQGLHAVLHEAAGRCKSSSQALLVLWRAFTAVLEHAGQNNANAEDSLAQLVKRGNEEEEKARIENSFSSQIASLQAQLEEATAKQNDSQEEVDRYRGGNMRLQSENEMYRNTHQVAVAKYEREIKQRVDAEVKLMEKTRWVDALQEDLAKERRTAKHIGAQLSEAASAREEMQAELDSLRTTVKMQEAQASSFKQAMLEAAQQKQRHEQQVTQYKANLERSAAKVVELKEQLDHEVANNKQQSEANLTMQRDLRRVQTKHEDELHIRRELQQERDVLRERIEKVEKDMGTVLEERRSMQKEINEVYMKHRKDQIDLKRTTEQLERTEQSLEKVEAAHTQLRTEHRQVVTEAEYMRQDIQHLDEQMKKESELRKTLQTDKKQLQSQLQTLTIERDTAQIAVNNTQRELTGVTEKMVKLESIVRETKSAMSKAQLEHQVELKANAQKVVMLERVIADERKERRNLVMESQEQTEKREDALNQLRKKELDMQDLRRERLEKEQEVDRLKVLLKAQEQRNSEQLVTVDKYHASVANYDAEMRQMHVLLECEREEAKQQLDDLQKAYAAGRHTLEQKIDSWKMCYEDVVSQLNFNPATTKLQALNQENVRLRRKLEETSKIVRDGEAKVRECEDRLQEKDLQYQALNQRLEIVMQEQGQLTTYVDSILQNLEHQSLAAADAEGRTEILFAKVATFTGQKAAYEAQLQALRQETERLSQHVETPTADAWTQVEPTSLATQSQQTDLSYQYLEAAEHLQVEPRRTERLTHLKKASAFVDGSEDGRDFNFKTKTVVHGQDLRFEPQAKTRIVHMTQATSSQTPPKTRRTPSPWS